MKNTPIKVQSAIDKLLAVKSEVNALALIELIDLEIDKFKLDPPHDLICRIIVPLKHTNGAERAKTMLSDLGFNARLSYAFNNKIRYIEIDFQIHDK